MGRGAVVVLDNYDSFTYTLVDLLARDDLDVRVVRNDRLTVDELVALTPDGLVISPGPCTPDEAGIAVEAVRALHGTVPILGVCLGHQAIAVALGATVVRAPYPEHGKVWDVHHGGSRLLDGLPSPFPATRYHSLVVDRSTLPSDVVVTATCTDGTVMALEHAEAATFGLQFHPESICTPGGAAMVDRFLAHCHDRSRTRPSRPPASAARAEGAWTAPPLAAGRRAAIREALGVGPVAPVVDEVDVAWEPDRWLAALDDGEVAGLLESSAGPDDVARWSIFGSAPRFVLTARPDGTTEVDGTALDDHLLDVLDALREPASTAPTEVPFVGGLIGHLAYDAGRWFEELPDTVAHDVGTPLAAFGYYEAALVHDERTGRTHLVRTSPEVDAGPWLAQLATRAPAATATTVDADAVTWNVTRAEYLAMVGRAREYVFAGDVFEVCLSRRFSMPLDGPPAPVHAALRERSPSPFAACCAFADHTLVSSSPERFLSWDGDRLETRPIKGTTRRQADPTANAAVIGSMRADRKQMAEHLMIVDLSRSDLGRVCAPGSVVVPDLARPETYSHVNHLVSVIEGRPPAEITVRSLLAAAFPGGSITGAPKVRAMEVIDELEPVARGAYTGSIGYLSVDGRIDLNIAIRTLVVADGRVHGQVGGAIVADSDPAAEWQETQDKAQGLLAALAAVANRAGSVGHPPDGTHPAA